MSKNLSDFGFVEELWLLGASKQTICKMTKLSIEQVERIIHQIEKNRDTLRGFKVSNKEEEYKC